MATTSLIGKFAMHAYSLLHELFMTSLIPEGSLLHELFMTSLIPEGSLLHELFMTSLTPDGPAIRVKTSPFSKSSSLSGQVHKKKKISINRNLIPIYIYKYLCNYKNTCTCTYMLMRDAEERKVFV